MDHPFCARCPKSPILIDVGKKGRYLMCFKDVDGCSWKFRNVSWMLMIVHECYWLFMNVNAWMLMGSVCIDTLVWKRTRRAQLTKVLGSLCQLGTSVHMQNQFSQPVTVVSQEQLQLLVQPPEASRLKLEDAPSYDTLWQICVLKTKILNHWMLGLQFSREQLSVGQGCSGSGFGWV